MEEVLRDIYNDAIYLVLPEREKRVKSFIRTAIEISNDYELDIEIESLLSHISVTYYFDCCAGMGFLRPLLEDENDPIVPPPDNVRGGGQYD